MANPWGGEIISLLLTYVDDILIARRRDGLGRFTETFDGYKTGALGKLNVGSTLQFSGLGLVRVSGSEIQLSQISFTSRLKVVDPNEYVRDGKMLLTPEKRRHSISRT